MWIACGYPFQACELRAPFVFVPQQICGSDKVKKENRGIRTMQGQAREVLRLAGNLNQGELADMFGVSRMTISLICRGKIWGWLQSKPDEKAA